MKKLKVITPFPYAGKMRKVGERISATNRHAAVLVLTGKVKIIEHREPGTYSTRVMVAEPQTTPNAPRMSRRERRRGGRRNGYARSDMVAE